MEFFVQHTSQGNCALSPSLAVPTSHGKHVEAGGRGGPSAQITGLCFIWGWRSRWWCQFWPPNVCCLTQLLHLIYSVNSVLPSRRSQAGGSWWDSGVMAFVLLQTTLPPPPSFPSPSWVAVESKRTQQPWTQDTACVYGHIWSFHPCQVPKGPETPSLALLDSVYSQNTCQLPEYQNAGIWRIGVRAQFHKWEQWERIQSWKCSCCKAHLFVGLLERKCVGRHPGPRRFAA